MCGRIVVVQGPVAILPFFRSFSANRFTQTSQDLQVEFLVNCLPVGGVLVVYDICTRSYGEVLEECVRRILSGYINELTNKNELVEAQKIN